MVNYRDKLQDFQQSSHGNQRRHWYAYVLNPSVAASADNNAMLPGSKLAYIVSAAEEPPMPLTGAEHRMNQLRAGGAPGESSNVLQQCSDHHPQLKV